MKSGDSVLGVSFAPLNGHLLPFDKPLVVVVMGLKLIVNSANVNQKMFRFAYDVASRLLKITIENSHILC